MITHRSKQPSVGRFIFRPRVIASALKWTFLSYRNWQNPILAFLFFLQIHNYGITGVRSLFHLGQVCFFVRPIDHYSFKEIILWHEYSFIRYLFKSSSPKIIVDLGANVGLFSVYMLSLWPLAQVHSLEAGNETYGMLHRNQKMNPELNWNTYQYAVWNQNGEINFKVNELLSTSSYVSPGNNGEKVQAITLENFCSTYLGKSTRISLLKMDIEGAEEPVLQSSLNLLARVENLIVEIHPDRCDYRNAISLLDSSFRSLYQISDRRSRKPMLLACNHDKPLPFCRIDNIKTDRILNTDDSDDNNLVLKN